MKRLRVYCSISNLPSVRDFMRSNLRDLDVNGKTSEMLVLAVDEACANAMIHQHNCDGSTFLELSLYRNDEQLFIELKDSGKAFPIDTFEPMSNEDRVKTHARGGMGILLIRSIMDSIEINQMADYHIFKFVKNLAF
jgi:serine/threonine-protein kinase RsbW